MKAVSRVPVIVLMLIISILRFPANSFGQPNYNQVNFLSMQEFELQAFVPKDDVWVIDFWASWCRPCIASIPELKEIVRKYEGRNVKVISVSEDQDDGPWLNAVTKYSMNWEQVKVPDPRNAPFIDKYFRHNYIPTLYLIEKSGKIRKIAGIQVLSPAIEKALKKER